MQRTHVCGIISPVAIEHLSADEDAVLDGDAAEDEEGAAEGDVAVAIEDEVPGAAMASAAEAKEGCPVGVIEEA